MEVGELVDELRGPFEEFVCKRCSDVEEAVDEHDSRLLAEALAGQNLDHNWNHRPLLTTAQWCAAWRKANRRPELAGPVRLYRGGGTPVSMSWTDNPGIALAFANHRYRTTWEYEEVLGPLRLPLWECVFPPDAVLAVLDAQREYIIDIKRYPANYATRYETTAEDVEAYREFMAPLLP